MEFCGCVQNKEGHLVNRLTDIWDEVVELIEVKNIDEFLDEWSDVVWGFGRLVGYFMGLKYVRIYGDERHYVKIKRRMEEYGCIRSRRHLKNGICCSVCLE